MCMHVRYLSVLKLGSYMHRDSNIRQVVQQNEWNKHHGLFKSQVPELLNLMDIKVVPYIKENKFILDIFWYVHPFGYWYSFFDHLPHNHHNCVASCMMDLLCFVSEWGPWPYAFINIFTSNHATELINSVTGTCHSTLNNKK